MPRVCVIGSSNLDFTVAVPHLPRPGETVSGGQLVLSPGGKGANQAMAARRLGADVRFITMLGTDPMGNRLETALLSGGLAAEGIGRTDEAPTGVALIAVDAEGRNQIAVAPGANHQLTPERLAAHRTMLAWADVVLLQLETPLETVRWALGEARRLGKRTILNPAPARVLPLPAELLALVDCLTPNETEAGLMAGQPAVGIEGGQAAGRRLVARGVGMVVVTLGAEGVVLVEPTRSIRVAPFDVPVVDTVGAGDAFNGALATLLAAGAPVEEALVVANAAGALACTRRGALDALPSRADVEALLERTARRPRVSW